MKVTSRISEVYGGLPGLNEQHRPFIVACIPAFNEERYIAGVVMRTQKYVHRVIVCSDGSSDLTADIARRMGASVVEHEKNLGKGQALKSLFLEASKMGADVTVTLDGDGQHNPDEIPALIQPILKGEVEIVSGSRFFKEGKMPRYRRIGNRLLNRLTANASYKDITDSQCGFRAYSREAIKVLEITEQSMGVDSQILIDAKAKNLRVKEMPVEAIYNEGSSKYNPVKHGLSVLISIVRTVAERSPLLYLGAPGLALSVASLVLAVHLLNLYTETGIFSIPLALISLVGFLAGLLIIITALILYAIANLSVRLRQ